jgi:hypothetical protein
MDRTPYCLENVPESVFPVTKPIVFLGSRFISKSLGNLDAGVSQAVSCWFMLLNQKHLQFFTCGFHWRVNSQ